MKQFKADNTNTRKSNNFRSLKDMQNLSSEEQLKKQKQELNQDIGSLTYLAVNKPWPCIRKEKQDGISIKTGFDGARAARVLLTLLARAELETTACMPLDKKRLAVESGLANVKNVTDALKDLQESRWIDFTPGKAHVFAKGVRGPVEYGKWSTAELILRNSEEHVSPRQLPCPYISIFEYSRLGTAGWFLLTQLTSITKENGEVLLGPTELCSLTGMTAERMKHVLKKLLGEGLCTKEKHKYLFGYEIISKTFNEWTYGASNYWIKMANLQSEKDYDQKVGRPLVPLISEKKSYRKVDP